jgi:hypothetical protein
MAESGCLRDMAVQNLQVTGTLESDNIISKLVTSTEIAGDLSTTFVNVTKSSVAAGIINYQVTVSLAGLHTNNVDNDIVGVEGAASTVVNLPTSFTLISGSARCAVVEGSTNVFNIVMSSTDNLAEDAVVTTGTFVSVLEDVDANSASSTFTSFKTVPSSSSVRYLYLTNSGTGNENADLDAGSIVINLTGYDNTNTIPSAIPLPSLNSYSRPVIKITASCSLNVSQSGSLLLVGPAAAGLGADTVVTLPTAAAGLQFDFLYVGGAADAQDLQINTGSDTNFFIGGLNFLDISDDTENEPVPVYGDNSSNSKVNIITPGAGTRVECVCDGTNWFLSGVSISASTPTFADQ